MDISCFVNVNLSYELVTVQLYGHLMYKRLSWALIMTFSKFFPLFF